MKTGGIAAKLLFAMVMLLLGAVAYFLVYPIAVHNYQLWNSGRSVDALSHPPGTERVQKYAQVGLLFGNGNHTDFWIKEIRSCKGDFLSIQRHYDRQQVVFPHGKPMAPEVALLASDSGDVPYDIAKTREWKDLLLASGSLYAITVYYQAPPEGDIRSH